LCCSDKCREDRQKRQIRAAHKRDAHRVLEAELTINLLWPTFQGKRLDFTMGHELGHYYTDPFGSVPRAKRIFRRFKD
jgi:hypothetical protein